MSRRTHIMISNAKKNAVQHERKPVSDRPESVQMSTSPDNNNIPTFSYGSSSFVKSEMASFIKNDLPFIKTEIPFATHRSLFNDQAAAQLLQSSSENDTSFRNQSYMDYYMAEDDESSASHSPSNDADVKPFSQDNKSLLALALDSMNNITQKTSTSHFLSNDADVKLFSRENKSLLALALHSMNNITQQSSNGGDSTYENETVRDYKVIDISGETMPLANIVFPL